MRHATFSSWTCLGLTPFLKLLPSTAPSAAVPQVLSPHLHVTIRLPILSAQVAVVYAAALVMFANRSSRYWPCTFPMPVLGNSSAMAVYTHTKYAFPHTPRAYLRTYTMHAAFVLVL